jgi:ankyrin repeat protein
MIAAYKGNLEIVEILIDHEADVSLQDKFGKKA